jgi:hypothetical protein
MYRERLPGRWERVDPQSFAVDYLGILGSALQTVDCRIVSEAKLRVS